LGKGVKARRWTREAARRAAQPNTPGVVACTHRRSFKKKVRGPRNFNG
jgi:hypothetical protein